MPKTSQNRETRILLIRHGQIQANIEKRWHGWTDSELTIEGRSQAKKAGQRLKKEHSDISALYCSPLKRTRHTADAIGNSLSLEVNEIEGLKEYGVGVLEGETLVDLLQKHDFFTQLNANPHYAPAGGESIHQVSTRVVDSLKMLAKTHQGEKIVTVSHGAAMALALANLLHDDPYQWGRYQFKNTSITELTFSDTLKLTQLNCTAHLETAP